MSVQMNVTRTIRISDAHWHQLEIEAKRLGFPTRHAYMIDRLKIVPQIEKAPETV